ncbi:MAG TPA: hypothetical protein VN753_19020 [Terracidiphilus sp.]|nr:hypothetical protein [Terracidiphilus sp.]
MVVNRLLKVLFAAQISLGGQDGHMTEEELNLLQLAAIHMAELGACSAKIVWCEMVWPNPLSDPSHHVPNDLLRDSLTPRRPVSADGAEDLARCHLC